MLDAMCRVDPRAAPLRPRQRWSSLHNAHTRSQYFGIIKKQVRVCTRSRPAIALRGSRRPSLPRRSPTDKSRLQQCCFLRRGTTGTTTRTAIPQAAGLLIVESEPVHAVVIDRIAYDGMHVPANPGERFLDVVFDQESRTVDAEVVTRIRTWRRALPCKVHVAPGLLNKGKLRVCSVEIRIAHELFDQ